MKLKFLLVVCLFVIASHLQSQTYASSNFTLVSHINPETGTNGSGNKYSGCWGWYQQNKNKEYAIACSQSGTYWVDVTIPATPTVSAYKLGAHMGATWREVKTYQNYCYVASDDGGTNRFQIFDMQYLPDSVSKVYDSQSLFKRGHTLWVDGNKLYVSSTTYSTNNFSSLNVYSLANPASPVLLRQLDQDFPLINHAHDVFVRNDTVYASCGFDGLYVFKFTAANTFSLISSLTAYPFSGYNHSSALTPNGQTLVFLDEVPSSLPIKVANVSNLSNIQVPATINQFSLTTPHNPFVVSNQYCFVSSYQDGLQLFDISSPTAPFLAGFFDTYYQAGGNTNNYPNGADYNGNWGAYPFLPSRNIIALDMKNGLYILKTHLYQNSGNAPTVGFVTPSNTICPGSTVTFTNTSAGATSYIWSFTGANPASSTATNPSVTYTTPGVHTIILSALNGTASSVYNGTVQVSTQILATIGSTNASCGTCTNGAASVNVFGGNLPYTFTWAPTGGNAYLTTGLAPGCYTITIKDVNNCAITKTTCVSFATGIAETEQLNTVLVYPNPAKNFVVIDYASKDYNVAIFNSLGQVVRFKNKAHEKTEIDLKDLPKGIYVVEIHAEKNAIRKKLIID